MPKPVKGEVVFDASALLALVNGESGADRVLDYLPRAVMSTVNASEAAAKLVELGVAEAAAWAATAGLVPNILPFDAEHARIAAGLRKMTRAASLSFGDRACLALAISRNADVMTADRAWLRLPLQMQILSIRS